MKTIWCSWMKTSKYGPAPSQSRDIIVDPLRSVCPFALLLPINADQSHLEAFHVSVWHQVEDDRYNQRLQSGTAASFSESHLDAQTSQVVGQQSPSVDPVPVPSATEPKLHLQLRSKQHGTTKAVMKKSSSVRKIIKWYFRKFSLPENLIDASSTKLIFDDEDLDKAILLKDTEIEDKDLLDIVW